MALGDRKSAIATVGFKKQQAIFNVCKDAEKILEELLDSRISDDVKGHKKVRRIKTGPHHEKEASHPVDTTVRRSRTLPGNYRESTEDLREKGDESTPELDNVLDNNDGVIQKNAEDTLLIVSNDAGGRRCRCRCDMTPIQCLPLPYLTLGVPLSDEVVKGSLRNGNNQADIASSGSSADTEEDSTNETQKRKKKSLLKRTKERIIQAFHRDEKGRNSTATVTASPTAAKSSKSKQDKAHIDLNPTEIKDNHSRTVDSSKGQLMNSPSSTTRRKTNFFSSFRRGKNSSKENENDRNRSKVGNNGQTNPELKALDLAANAQTNLNHQDSDVASSHPETKRSKLHLSLPDKEKSPQQQNAKEQLTSDGVAWTGTENLTKNTIITDPVHSGKKPTSLTLEHIRSHEQSDPSAFSKLPRFTGQESVQSSVLDSPGEDIEFIDAFQPEAIFPCPPVYSGPSHDARFQSPRSPSRSRDALPQALSFPDEIDGFNYESEAAGEDKEAQYKLIAQKLAEMGDSLMHESDLSSKSKTNEPVGKTNETVDLTLLASEITEHLRAVGDRVTEQTTQDLYRRFYSTVQNSLGHEVSWNHVAFLYHAIKDVVSAVGKGTRAAVMAKEWTLQYVSDTMASWIIDQGGFENLLSSDESDFGVD